MQRMLPMQAAAKEKNSSKPTSTRNTRLANKGEQSRTTGKAGKTGKALKVVAKPVCGFFLRGVCKQGAQCEYQHVGVPRTKSQVGFLVDLLNLLSACFLDTTSMPTKEGQGVERGCKTHMLVYLRCKMHRIGVTPATSK